MKSPIALLALAGFRATFRVKTTKRYAVPGDGGFNYVTFDSSSNRIYALHGTKAVTFDADNKLIFAPTAMEPYP